MGWGGAAASIPSQPWCCGGNVTWVLSAGGVLPQGRGDAQEMLRGEAVCPQVGKDLASRKQGFQPGGCRTKGTPR